MPWRTIRALAWPGMEDEAERWALRADCAMMLPTEYGAVCFSEPSFRPPSGPGWWWLMVCLA